MSGRSAFDDLDAFDELAQQAAGERPGQQKVTYWLDRRLVRAVRSIAQRERFGKKGYSAVAAAFLDFALTEYEAGRVRIEMIPDGEDWRAALVSADQ